MQTYKNYYAASDHCAVCGDTMCKILEMKLLIYWKMSLDMQYQSLISLNCSRSSEYILDVNIFVFFSSC